MWLSIDTFIDAKASEHSNNGFVHHSHEKVSSEEGSNSAYSEWSTNASNLLKIMSLLHKEEKSEAVEHNNENLTQKDKNLSQHVGPHKFETIGHVQ